MIEKGWDHDTLNAMDETEFLFHLETRIELEEARAAAIKAARE